jgi:hypothetical protein
MIEIWINHPRGWYITRVYQCVHNPASHRYGSKNLWWLLRESDETITRTAGDSVGEGYNPYFPQNYLKR